MGRRMGAEYVMPGVHVSQEMLNAVQVRLVLSAGAAATGFAFTCSCLQQAGRVAAGLRPIGFC